MRAVFLDRDGVINRAVIRDGKPYAPASPADVEVPDDVAPAMARLKAAGFLLVTVTNQPDVARGTQTRANVEAIDNLLRGRLPLDDVFVCYHDGDACDCRKPKPGLLLQAAAKYPIDIGASFLVGDRWRDIDAGAAAGCRTVWIDYGYAERGPSAPPSARVHSFGEAAEWILAAPSLAAPMSNLRTARDLRVKLFADGADLATILDYARDPLIRGFTTNPTLMRKAGVANYEEFARTVLSHISDRPISFEVFADDFAEMERQAHKLAALAPNVYVKIPITNTARESSIPLLQRLRDRGVKVNVTAVLTLDQTRAAAKALAGGPPACISIFAGRVADSGTDPVPVMRMALDILRASGSNLELIWASPRELLNVLDADRIGCHIITVTADILKKLPLLGKDLEEYSLETVKMFRGDSVAAGYTL